VHAGTSIDDEGSVMAWLHDCPFGTVMLGWYIGGSNYCGSLHN